MSHYDSRKDDSGPGSDHCIDLWRPIRASLRALRYEFRFR